ncbi:MAG: glycine--tRNA ligase subunit beta [Desulfobacterales bacterium GWB2_56_26]|nr:MAG: glycine--tRNA ligase subunit beta [Desulfobacterales bacterium GWB2_56_26]
MRDLLFEIGMEEIPAGFLQPALTQLQDRFTAKAAELNFGHGVVKVMGTPRRLALIVYDVEEKQRDTVEELLGPAKKAAFDGEGKPTRALEGFARSKGAAVSDLRPVETPKGEYMMLVREVKGTDTASLLPGVLHNLILELSFPKSMRWGNNRQSFARPIQWLVALFGEEILHLSHEGIESSNTSIGHRFLDKRSIVIRDAAHYEQQLGDHYVMVDSVKRRSQVVAEIKRAVAESKELQDGTVAIDEGLVDTVTNLVEMPFGVCGVFDEKFLQLPAEVLITSMREHQKYFPVMNSSGKLLPGFVAVNNTKVIDTDITRKGHQRVLRARLEDALFFFNSDRENRLESHVANLHGIIFQAKLGTMLEKKDRLVKLAKILADKIDPGLAEDSCRAALLCKADLLSNMVGEFPTLQGIMGGAYALHDGEKEPVATAIVEHYMPKRAGAEIPATDVGAILALADRFDTLAGCFGIGQVPSGTADPFGLRRITLAILNIIQGKGYSLSLRELIHKALALYGDKVDGGHDTVAAVLNFVKARFANDCVSRGYQAEAVDAATSVNFDDVNECLQRINAMMQIRKEPAFKVLSASYKRIRNIIKDNRNVEIDPALFADGAESRLYELFLEVRQEMENLVAAREYVKALEVMLRMKEPVDNFFDKVMVMAEDAAIRQNRLNLLTALGDLILQIGDISRFQET